MGAEPVTGFPYPTLDRFTSRHHHPRSSKNGRTISSLTLSPSPF
jgi:hypothetical protein